MKMVSRRLLLMVAILAPMSLGAQTDDELPKFEVTGNVGGGLNSLMYRINGKSSAPSAGFGAGIGFNWFFTPSWSFGTGVEYSMYNGSISLGEVESGHIDVYNEYYSAVWHYAMYDFKEKQRMGSVQVPLMFTWMTPLKLSSPHRFYIGFGAKLGFNLKGSYSQECSGMGYQYRQDWYYDPYEECEEFPGFKTGNELEFALMNVAGSLEIGFRWKLGNSPLALYTGAYLDAGIPDLFPKVSEDPIVFFRMDDSGPASRPRTKAPVYDDPDAMATMFDHNSVLQAHSPHYATVVDKDGEKSLEWHRPTSHYSKHLTTLSSGIVLKLSFGFGKRKSAPEPVEAVPAPMPEPEPEPEPAETLPEPEPEPVEPEVVESVVEEVPVEIKRSMMELSNSLFEFDKFTLDETVIAELNKVTAWLIENPDLKVSVEGHTDNVGDDRYNQRLSESRAKAVVDYFIANGVSADRLSYVGYGESRPIADNSSDEGRQVNRRVELKIINQE